MGLDGNGIEQQSEFVVRFQNSQTSQPIGLRDVGPKMKSADPTKINIIGAKLLKKYCKPMRSRIIHNSIILLVAGRSCKKYSILVKFILQDRSDRLVLQFWAVL